MKKFFATIGKYWKFIVIGLGFVLGAIILATRKAVIDLDDERTFTTELSKAKDKMQEAKDTATVKINAARSEEAETLMELNEISKIKDGTERRSRLAGLAKRGTDV